jgi:hypothetical protein
MPVLRRTLLALAATLLLTTPALAETGPGDPAAFVATFFADAPEPTADAPEDWVPPEEPKVYAPSLQALMDLDVARDMNFLDFDWTSGGQDTPEYNRLKIVVLKKTEATAQVRVTFLNYKQAHERLFDLVVIDGRWMIEDVYLAKPEGRWLSRILVENPQD